MGRRKIAIAPIQAERNRSVTFLKRKTGLMKKAFELGVLCNVDIAVVIFEKRPGHESAKLYEYSSSKIDDIIQRQLNHGGERDHKSPNDFNGHGKDDDDDEEGDAEEEEEHVEVPVTRAKTSAKAAKKQARSPSASSVDLNPRTTRSSAPQHQTSDEPIDHIPSNSNKKPRLDLDDPHYPPYFPSYRPSSFSPFAMPPVPGYGYPPPNQRRPTLDSYPARMDYNYQQAALYHQRMQQHQADSGVDLLQAMFGGGGDEPPRSKHSFPSMDWPVHGQSSSTPLSVVPPPPSQHDWLEYLTAGAPPSVSNPDMQYASSWEREQHDISSMFRERQEALMRDRQDALLRERQESALRQRQPPPSNPLDWTLNNTSSSILNSNNNKRHRTEADDGALGRSLDSPSSSNLSLGYQPQGQSPPHERGRTRTRTTNGRTGSKVEEAVDF